MAIIAIKAINTLSEKVSDETFSGHLASQALKYSEIHTEASKQLMAAKAPLYQANALADMMLKTGIHYNTMLNTSTEHLAELMIKGSNNGILEMEKVLKHNEEAGTMPVKLAQQLIAMEEKSISCMKDYL